MNFLSRTKTKIPKRVYVAGPMTAANSLAWEKNIRRAEDVMLSLYLSGFSPHCPHAHGRFLRDVVDYKTALAADKAQVAGCAAVVVCPGWEDSRGTKEEIEFCKKYNIPYFFSVENLIQAEKKGLLADVIVSRKQGRRTDCKPLHTSRGRRKKSGSIISWLAGLFSSRLVRGRKT